MLSNLNSTYRNSLLGNMLHFIKQININVILQAIFFAFFWMIVVNTQVYADDSKASGIHYFKVDDGSHLIVSFVTTICGTLAGGTLDKSMKLECRSGSCSAKYTMESDYTKLTVYLTPQFDALFEAEQEKGIPEIKELRIPFLDKSDAKIAISLSSTISKRTEDQIASQAECFRKVGKMLIDHLKPYDTNSVLASISTSDSETYDRAVYEIPYMDQGLLYVSRPKHIERGKPFILEATLIISQKMGIKNPPPTIDHQIEMAKDALGDALRLIGKPYRRGFEQLIEENKEASVEIYQQEPLPLSGLDSTYSAATAELVAGDVTISSVGAKKKTVKPLQAVSWSWVITGKKSDDITAYLSIVASGAGGAEATKVIPITFHVSPDWFTQTRDFLSAHVEWLVGSALIPVVGYAWTIWSKRRHKHLSPSHQKPVRTTKRR